MSPAKTFAAGASPAGTYITSDNDFYAYVAVGENLNTSFVKAINGSGGGDDNAVITISRPGASDTTCTVTAASAATTSCVSTNQTASTSGIWRVHFAHTSTQIDYYTWSISVEDGSSNDIPGRVWSTVYNLQQIAGTPSTGVDFSMWYESEFGYLYQADYGDYNGIQSVLQAGGLGLVKSGGGCTPLYKSVLRENSNWAIAPSNCDSAYKLFYEVPASDLPVSASQWDSTTDWVKPVLTPPAISNLSFMPNSSNSRDGNINFDVSNFAGSLVINIDTNGNGIYTDPGDVTIPFGATDGANSVAFNGKDGNGNTIPKNQALTFKVTIAHTAEIHFLMTDVELIGGGTQITRLNGPVGGETTIYWDDTDFADPDANRCSFTPQIDGTAGVDSTGGVHGWDLTGCGAPNYGNFNNGVNGSWGDDRIINDWAYAPSNTSTTYVLSAFTEAPTAVLADTGQDTNIFLGLAAGLVLVPASVLLVFKKRLLS